jgi:hypothetical protein
MQLKSITRVHLIIVAWPFPSSQLQQGVHKMTKPVKIRVRFDINSICKIKAISIVLKNGVGNKQRNMWKRVVWGCSVTGALMKFHSHVLSFCLLGLNRSHPHAQGKCTCTRGRGATVWTHSLPNCGCLLYWTDVRIGDCTYDHCFTSPQWARSCDLAPSKKFLCVALFTWA